MTTAIDINTNENISIKPIAIYQSDAFDVLLLADANTGKGIWRVSTTSGIPTRKTETSTTTPTKSKTCTAQTKKNGRPRQTRSLRNMVLSSATSTRRPETVTR